MSIAGINTITIRNLLMLAAENGALEGGKVGGIGDVLRDLPVALADRNWQVTVMTPSYGVFHRQKNTFLVGQVAVTFAGLSTEVDVYEVPGEQAGVSHLVLEHPLFSPNGPGHIYCHDDSSSPFATDATKFAFFSAASAACVKADVVTPDVVHVHDWHGALFLALRAYAPDYACLKDIRTVYTIHNLALQGIRPLNGHTSSFESWFPELNYHHGEIVDPRYHDCVNPMAVGIRLADCVNTVSPSYALEILDANNPQFGFHGGEGLELDLQLAASEHRLAGILNGCSYDKTRGRRPAWRKLRESMVSALDYWMGQHTYIHSSHFLAHKKVVGHLAKKPSTLLVSIGRVTAQKVSLFLRATSRGPTALEEILEGLSEGELFVLLGNGDDELSLQLSKIAHRYDRFLFLEGYADGLPDLLYRLGDVFLMPSSFEPCGISQMFAMREGQPCVVHGVGGLNDTVEHGRTGFVFEGDTPVEQADNFVATVKEVLKLRASDKPGWKTLRETVRDVRFSWETSAIQYEQVLYAHNNA